MRREVTGRARYEEIAVDLAQRIAVGEVAEGSRVLGRSSLAATYQVSPETIRRAVAILHARGIVQSVAGSGIRVISRVAAGEFVEALGARAKVEDSAGELHTLLRQQQQLNEKMAAALDRLVGQTARVFGTRHVEEVQIPPGAWVVGRSLPEIALRTRTGATAVAVTRGEEDWFSPPPSLLLAPGDVVTIVGSEPARTLGRELLESEVPPPGPPTYA